MLSVVINGHRMKFAPGISLLQAIGAAGFHVPTLCHDDRLKPCGSCRLCTVEIRNQHRMATACNTELADGMEIVTHSPPLEAFRRSMLRLLAADYPAEAVAERPDKEFHGYLEAYGVRPRGSSGAHVKASDDTHPYIHVDLSRCVLCYRCVRICDEVQGQFVWQIHGRGTETQLLPASGHSLLESRCVSCGACVDTCPTGALDDKSELALGRPTAWTRTTCPYCGTGCEMSVGTLAGRITDIRPVPDAPVSKGHLCVKGRYAWEFVHSSERVTEPMIRSADGRWQQVSWQEAISVTAERLRRVIKDHGPDAIGILGSARATNEENYLLQKFARVVLGTNNVDCCARVCHAPSAAALSEALGSGAATNSFADIERARTIFMVGCNPTENHPIVGARIRQAARRGANLIVIDSRATELAGQATLHLAARPGTTIPLLNAMAFTIVEEGLWDREWVEARCESFEEFAESVRKWRPEDVAELCGLEAAQIRAAARLYATARPAMSFHGLGVTEHTQGTEAVRCLVNLALLTGNVGRAGSGVNPLRGQNNVQGAVHMGCEPSHLTGYADLEAHRALFEHAWGASLPSTRGANLLDMMDAAAAGRLKALYVVGYDVLVSNPTVSKTRQAMGSLDVVIVQDMFLNETAKEFGTVFLPATSSFEKDGTFMNAERRIQRVRSAVQPVGNSLPDWQIVCRLAQAMGQQSSFDFESPEAIWEEIRKVWPAGAGITYKRLDRAGLQWPCPTENHPGTAVLHADQFPIGKRAVLRSIEYISTTEQVQPDFPLLLITGRSLYQFNAGTMSMRTPNRQLRPTDLLDISVEDARRFGVCNGDEVHVISRYGEAVLPVHVTDSIRPGEVFATFQDPRRMLNLNTGPYRDSRTSTPQYKVTAVRIERPNRG